MNYPFKLVQIGYVSGRVRVDQDNDCEDVSPQMGDKTVEFSDVIEYFSNGQRKLRVRVLKVNPPVQTTCFLIHGSMGSLTQFNDLILKLKLIEVNIVAYDFYGCGGSDKPHVFSAYSGDKLLEDFKALFDHFGSSRNILIGHSYGTCQIAKFVYLFKSGQESSSALYDSQPGHTIDAIILISSTYHIKDGGHPIFKMPLFVLNRMQNYLSRQFISLAYSPATSDELKRQSLQLSGQNDMYVCKAFYQQFKWCKHEEWMSLLAYPLLIMHGADDKLLPLIGSRELLRNLESAKATSNSSTFSTSQILYPISFEVINDCGHQIMIEKPEETYECIKHFLAKINVLSNQIVLNDINAYWNENTIDDTSTEPTEIA